MKYIELCIIITIIIISCAIIIIIIIIIIIYYYFLSLSFFILLFVLFLVIESTTEQLFVNATDGISLKEGFNKLQAIIISTLAGVISFELFIFALIVVIILLSK